MPTYRRRRARRFTATDWERLGLAVKRERALQDLTQVGLARKAGVSVDVIERLERTPHTGSEIMMTNLFKIEYALGMEAGTAERILKDEPTPDQIPAQSSRTRRGRILGEILSIPGLGSTEIEALINALDQSEAGKRSK